MDLPFVGERWSDERSARCALRSARWRCSSLPAAVRRRSRRESRSCRRPSRRRSRRSRTRRAWCASAPANYERALERLEGRRRARSAAVGGLVRRRLDRARAPSHRRGDRALEKAQSILPTHAPDGRRRSARPTRRRAGPPTPPRSSARSSTSSRQRQGGERGARAAGRRAAAGRQARRGDRDAADGRCASSRARRPRSRRSAWSTRRAGSTSSPIWCCTARSRSTRSPRPRPRPRTTSAWSRWRAGAIRRRSPTSIRRRGSIRR